MTNIIDPDELDLAMAQQGKRKKKKPVGGSGSRFLGSSSSGKPRPYARLSRSLINKPVGQLWDFVKEHVGEVESDELKEKMGPKVTKVQVANWIEQRETLLYGRHPKSELPSKSLMGSDMVFCTMSNRCSPRRRNGRCRADRRSSPLLTAHHC
jgi:hypothetical protein